MRFIHSVDSCTFLGLFDFLHPGHSYGSLVICKKMDISEVSFQHFSHLRFEAMSYFEFGTREFFLEF